MTFNEAERTMRNWQVFQSTSVGCPSSLVIERYTNKALTFVMFLALSGFVKRLLARDVIFSNRLLARDVLFKNRLLAKDVFLIK